MPPWLIYTTRQRADLFSVGRYFAIIAALGLLGAAGVRAELAGGEEARIELARQFARDLAAHRFADATKHYDATMRKVLPADKLEAIWTKLEADNGAVASFGEPRTSQAGAYKFVFVPAVFERARLDIKVVFDQKDRVAGLFFVPAGSTASAYKPPAYNRPSRYTETEVEFGKAPWQVKGRLTVPRSRALAPVVVLVHGSGPHDEDESIGPNKPFLDLAEGLSSNGIAVLRYQKRTFAHRDQLLARGSITLHEEVIDDALAALAFVRTQSNLDRSKVYLLGHSLGATLAPQIASEDKNLAGIILLSGTPRDPFEVIEEQLGYIASLPGPGQGKNKAAYSQTRTLIAKIKAQKASGAEMLLGAPVSYWQEWQSTAAESLPILSKLTCRVLVLGGGRDYQVTREDFDLYRKTLKGHKQATLKWYPDCSHLFVKGKGKATPEEYSKPGYVDEAVVQYLVGWIGGD